MRTKVLVAGVVCVLAALTACAPPVPPPVEPDPPPGATGPSDGCGTTARGPQTDQAEALVADGLIRRFTMTLPPGHTPGTTTPVPLVLDLHGLLEGFAGTHPFSTRFSEKAIEEGFAVVFPIGQSEGVFWDYSAREDNPDLRFIDALLEHVEASTCVDRSRIYVTGLSNGAFMTSMLMCMRPNTFAAAAPVAGIMDLCHATERSVPFVTFHGTADPILPYDAFAATPQAIATKYGCDASPAVTTLSPDPDPSTYGPITLTSWDCGGSAGFARSYVVGGGGHSWPGSLFFQLVGFIVGPTATSLDATDVIWDFFAHHHL